MEMLYEIGKTVGAISGLFALGLVLWDRYTKHYPVAIIVARPLIDGSRQIVPFLHLKNSSDRPLLVSWSDGDLHKMRVGKGQTLVGILQTLLEAKQPFRWALTGMHCSPYSSLAPMISSMSKTK
jgi:hypothetical protein